MTLLRVHFNPDLVEKIGSLEDLEEIASLLREWKVIDLNGQIATQDHWFFGRDKPNNPVRGQASSYAFHVHLQPLGTSAERAWEQSLDDPRLTPYDRTSDRIAVYSVKHSAPFAGLLLFDIVDDPGGHAIFDRSNALYANLLKTWDRAADRHQDVGIVPKGFVTI